MLRLDSRYPVLWRTPTSLQIGVGGRVVLEEVDTATERAVAALVAGVSDSGLRALARGLDAEALLARLEPVLAVPPARGRRIAVAGEGAIAAEAARQLADSGARVGVEASPDLVIVVADRVLAPEDHGRWLRRDVPHLPVVAGEESIEIGPLVVPGSGPCLYCVHLARCDADAAWPALATQLARLDPPVLPRTVVAEAAALAVRRALAPHEEGRAWSLAVESGEVRAREFATHPGCRCAAPPESDWAPAAAPAAPPAPRRARAGAVPA